ncbi:MAG: hypothetical protein CVV21_11795 [Candidatus Goldiibacteriota bacterium HGW-Goldbacteria-1]|jgi:hypothetical protein|nr:MAG: hypothetical protein CVV21_11795 [Candidatus Goldiibacteriota bacterium HGW-Goldbacteria-1]
MKIKAAVLILFLFFSNAYAVSYSDEKFSFGGGYSAAFPLFDSAYAVIHSADIKTKFINDGFFMAPFLSLKFASGTAVKNGDKAGGMYGAIYDAPLFTAAKAGYFGAQAGAGFGFYPSELFDLKQSAGFSFSTVYENENIEGLRQISGMEKYIISVFAGSEIYRHAGIGAAELLISASFNGRYDGGKTDAFFISAGLFFETEPVNINTDNTDLYEYNSEEPERKDNGESGGVWE